jgi:hypothetical protein
MIVFMGLLSLLFILAIAATVFVISMTLLSKKGVNHE